MSGAERKRMEHPGHPEEGLHDASPWYAWGPYLSERAWGGVREDYSADGDAWNSFPHDHARSRAYRWNEDGMAGVSDVFNRLCLALALWNGKDPILKERMYGLSNQEGNHGEDSKDYWWYLDALPSSAWLRWRYHYPQAAFPYEDLIAVNGSRSKFEPEYELIDTGIFDDDRYWIVEVHYAKADPTDILMRVVIRNQAPEAATLHVLPTLWFRNDWSWDPTAAKPSLTAAPDGASIDAAHAELGEYTLHVGPGPDGSQPELLFCENETNVVRLHGEPATTPYPKDGINDHLIAGTDTVNPARTGTKAAAWYQVTVPAGGSAELQLRLTKRVKPRKGSAPAAPPEPFGRDFSKLMATREAGGRRVLSRSRPVGFDTPRKTASCARPSPGCSGASSTTPTTSRAGSTETPGCPGRRRGITTSAIPTGGTSTRPTSCRCPTRGSTPGSRPGISRSTPSPWPTSTRPSPSTSFSSCAASGSSTPTARCPPTSGRSTTSIRRSMPPRPTSCGRSTAART